MSTIDPVHTVDVVLLVALGFAACTPSAGSYACDVDPECTLAGAQGICEANGYCSFADATCLSGQRFGGYAPVGIGGRCVPSQAELDDAGLADAEASSDAEPGAPDASAPVDASEASPVDASAPVDAGAADASPPPDQQATFSASGDTWIDSMNPTQNHGVDPVLRADGDPLRHALLRFDVSTLPASAIVTSASIDLYTTADGALASGSVQVFRVLESWSEGTQNGADGSASWTNRASATPWATVGAGAPGSHDATVLSSFAPSANGALYHVTLPASVVQTWRTSGAYDGVLLVAKDTGTASALFVAKEGASGKRPLLRVVYHLP